MEAPSAPSEPRSDTDLIVELQPGVPIPELVDLLGDIPGEDVIVEPVFDTGAATDPDAGDPESSSDADLQRFIRVRVPADRLPEVEQVLSGAGAVVESFERDGFAWGAAQEFPEALELVFETLCAAGAVRLAPDVSSVKVAVVDSGVDPDHADFGDRLVTGVDATAGPAASPKPPKDCKGPRYCEPPRSGSSGDRHGHGTKAAGLIAASGKKGFPRPPGDGRGMKALGAGCTVIPVKVLRAAQLYRNTGSVGNPVCTPTQTLAFGQASEVAAGIKAAVKAGATVVNLSLQSASSKCLLKAVDDAVRRGVVLVAAAGNIPDADVGREGVVRLPASLDAVVAVGAVDRDPSSWSRLPHSEYGKELHVVAPGDEVYTTVMKRRSACQGGVAPTGTLHRYTGDFGQTSAACALVSSVVVLMRAALPGMNAQDALNILRLTARSKPSRCTDPRPPSRFDKEIGWGMVDATAAVRMALRWRRLRELMLRIVGGEVLDQHQFSRVREGVLARARETARRGGSPEETVRREVDLVSWLRPEELDRLEQETGATEEGETVARFVAEERRLRCGA